MDDDRLEPSFLARCLSEFADDPELGLVFTNHTFAAGRNSTVRQCEIRPGRHDHFERDLLKHRPVAISAALWRSDAWQHIRPLPDTAAADMVLFGRIAELGYPFCYIAEPLMHYRVHEEMYSSTRGFRDHTVRAWDSLTFTNIDAQRERDKLLARALLSRAAAEIMDGDLKLARSDIGRASSLRPHGGIYSVGLRLAASSAPAAAIARGVAHVRTALKH
jgi:hypothetical protein